MVTRCNINTADVYVFIKRNGTALIVEITHKRFIGANSHKMFGMNLLLSNNGKILRKYLFYFQSA